MDNYAIISPVERITGKDINLPLLFGAEPLKHRSTHRIEWHSHPLLELHYVFSGAISYEFSNPSHRVTVPGGHFFIIPANARHRAVNDEATPSVRSGFQFNAPTAANARQTPFTPAELKLAFTRLREHATRVFRASADGLRAAREITRAIENDDISDTTRLRTLFASLLVETLSELKQPVSLRGTDDVVPKIMHYIREHCTEQLSVSDLVSVSGYGKSRLFSLFTQEAGITPNDYQNRCRVHIAEKLIKHGGKSLTEIAAECGFSSSSYFCTVFRKYTGLSPSNLKK